ncbi:MAG TPA: protein phosphatase 2C domain-containing protein [Trebonia sp.]|nr:protein phosphatase 2C domain-containing protein [Trebonia sp.]
MTTTTDPGPWRAIVGTARGAAHVARGLDNQDSVESQFIDVVGGTVVAVADGHGHDRHFRSATGSRLATRTACAVIAELAGELAGKPWTAELAGALCGKLPQAIVDQWRAGVAGDIAAHPYAADELAALERAGDGPEIPYGSTLLVALVTAGWLVCAQIGDGDLVGIWPDGQAWSPVAGDDLLDGHRTTSLCQSGAVASFRTAVHDLRFTPLLALLLGTDGYGNAQVRDPWQPQVAGDITELAIEHDDGWFAEQLPAWAQRCASADGSGDDTTVALLLAPDSRQRAAAARPAVRPDEATVPAAPTVPITMAAPVTTPLPPPLAPPPLAPPPPGPAGGPVSPARPPSAPAYEAGTAPSRPPNSTVPPGPVPPGPVPPGPVPPGPGRHAAPQSRRGRRRVAFAGIGAVVAATAIAVGLVMSQSSGQSPAAKPTAQPAPKATQTATPTATTGVPAKRATATPPGVATATHRPSGTATRTSKAATEPAGTATVGQLTQNQGG